MFDIMRNNAEGVTNEIILSLYQNYMPKWMVDSIQISRRNLTYRSYLLDTVIQHQEGMAQAGYNTLRSILEDTAGLDMGLYRAWLDSIDTKWAKYEMVKSYMHEAKYDTLEDILNAYDTAVVKTVADSVEYKNFSDYVLHYADWLSTDSSLMRLDSANFVQLLNDAGNNEHLKGTEMARNVLNFFYDSLYFTPPQWPEGSSGKKENVFMTSQPDEKPRIREPKANIKLYPNPAKDYLVIEYGFTEEQTIQVTDVYGRIMAVQQIRDEVDKIEINTANFGSGIYFLQLLQYGKALEKGKFNIMK